MKKKVISIILLLAILAPMIQPICLATEEELQIKSNEGIETLAGEALTSGDFQYTIDSDNVTITKYIGNAEIVEIPETIDGKTVTRIEGGAFQYCTSLTSITIPNSITGIGSSAFEGCSGLTSITIPEGVTRISLGTFRDCNNLTNVTIPDSVTDIWR